MSLYALSGACESGLLYALLALGVFLSYRVMKIPDLTVDGSFGTGAAVSAVLALNGMPLLGVLLAFPAGMAAGAVSALLHTRLRVPPVLAGILTMTALYSVNLRILGNKASFGLVGKDTVFTPLEGLEALPFGNVAAPLLLAAVAVTLLALFFRSTTGLSVRATGDNEVMVRSSSINTAGMKLLALSLSNGFAALSGALLAQQQRYVEVNIGHGSIVMGLAALILGETLLRGRKSVLRNLLAAVVGMVLYRLLTAVVLQLNVSPSDLKLMSALIVVLALAYPIVREKLAGLARRREAGRHA